MILLGITLLVNPCFSKKKQKIHPANIKIMKYHLKGPWPYKLKWPEVPRILATDAFMYYKAGKAMIIDSDGDVEYKDHHLYNAVHIRADKLMKMSPKQLKIKKKLLIVYCA